MRVGKNFELAFVKEETIVHGRRIDPIGERLRSFDQEIIAVVIEELNLQENNRKMKNNQIGVLFRKFVCNICDYPLIFDGISHIHISSQIVHSFSFGERGCRQK